MACFSSYYTIKYELFELSVRKYSGQCVSMPQFFFAFRFPAKSPQGGQFSAILRSYSVVKVQSLPQPSSGSEAILRPL